MNERNLQTVEEFVVNGWRNTSPARLTSEITSVYKETHRLVDEYPYYLEDEGLKMIAVDEYGQPEKILINDILSRSGYLGQAEGKVFDDLESWAKNNDGGTAVWFSPSYPGTYPCSKMIVHKLAYEFGTMRKTISNSLIVFDSVSHETLQMIHLMFPQTKDINNLEGFRSILINTDADLDPESLLIEIGKIDKNVLKAKQVLSKDEVTYRVNYISRMITTGADARAIAYEAQRLGLLGEHSISCPSASKSGTFSELLTGFSGIEDAYGTLQFSCPKCGSINTRPFGQLISNCQHCGGDVTC